MVIAALNAADTLGRAIESVLAQTYSGLELVVMDGGSNDGTLELLNRFVDSRLGWYSENDDGIYDAWNKALARTWADYYCFLGADDQFSDSGVVAEMVAAADSCHYDLVFGRIAVTNQSGAIKRLFGGPWDWPKMQRNMCVAHPGALHARSLFDRFGAFDTRYKIAGDYDFLLRIGNRSLVAFVDKVIVFAEANGISERRVFRVQFESAVALVRNVKGSGIRAWLQFFLGILRWAAVSLKSLF